MNRFRVLYLLAALGALVSAIGILLHTGLPQRAEFTGLILTPGTIPIAPEIDAYAPPFTLTSLEGEPLYLADFRGKTVILNFWATWCEPCKVEMPELQKLSDAYDVVVIGINLGENTETVRQWVNDLGLTFEIALDVDGYVTMLYQVRGQPSTYVISPDGILTHIFYGAVDVATLRSVPQISSLPAPPTASQLPP